MNKWKLFLQDLNESGRMMYNDPDSLRVFLVDQLDRFNRPDIVEKLRGMNTCTEMQKYMFNLYVEACRP